MIKVPLDKWSQLNKSDKLGLIAYSKNMNFDFEGYVKLSPRAVNLFDDSGSVANSSDTDFDYPLAFGRFSSGNFRLATADEPFDIDLSDTGKSISEDSDANNPNLTTNSHGCWWQGRFYESTATGVSYNDSGTWTANVITGLTSGVRHMLCVFKNLNALAVSNGNTVNLYDSSHALLVTLTIPADFEVIGMAYNNSQLGIATRLGNDTEGQNAEAFFFLWDGATEQATGVSIGAYSMFGIIPYDSSFIIITSSGQKLLWNGGGFQDLASFPFYVSEHRSGDLLTNLSYGDPMVVDGDVVYTNLGFNFSPIGKKGEQSMINNPSGVWCFDPQVGLYHRYSASISKAYFHSIASGNIDVTTNVFTTSVPIPPTGGQVIMTTQTIGGLKPGVVYYVIKLTSTTFKLATTKENAMNLVAIDITSVSVTNYLMMYDIIDFAQTNTGYAGAIALWGLSKMVYRDIIFGGNYYDSSLSTLKALCTIVPFLENRGYLVLAKLFTPNPKESIPKIYIKHKPLDTNDAIIIKVKQSEFVGIPTSAPDSSSRFITWVSANECTTSIDLSEVKTAFDDGEEMELELTGGVGAGQMVKISEIEESGGSYTLTLEEDVVGAAANLKSFFIIDNWKFFDSIDVDSQTDGLFEVALGEDSSGKSPQIKIELRGYETAIEDILIDDEIQEQ